MGLVIPTTASEGIQETDVTDEVWRMASTVRSPGRRRPRALAGPSAGGASTTPSVGVLAPFRAGGRRGVMSSVSSELADVAIPPRPPRLVPTGSRWCWPTTTCWCARACGPCSGLEADLEVVGVAADYDELVAAAEPTHPQVVVTDIRMPPTFQREGIEAARQVRKRHPGTGIVVLSQYDEPEYAIALLEAGRRPATPTCSRTG